MVLATAPTFAADVAAPPKQLPPEAKAETAPDVIGFAAGVRVQSDYNFRGITQSDHRVSPQGYLELQFLDNLLYTGLAIYNVHLPTRPAAEVDLTGGIRPKLGPLQFDFGFIYYYYPHERRFLNFGAPTDYVLPDGTTVTGPAVLTVANTDFLEGVAKVSWAPSDALTFGANVFHTNDWLGTGATGTYASLTGKFNIPQGAFGFLPEGFSFSTEVGRYWLGTAAPLPGGTPTRLPDYTYFNAGVTYTYKNFAFDLRYHDTDLNKRDCFTLTTDPRGVFTGSNRSNWCDARIIATASFDFTTKDPGIFARDSAAPAQPGPPKESGAGGERVR